MRLRSILAIARTTVIEQIRNRLYLIILFFGALILGASTLVGALAPDHKARVILDLGLLSLELFGLATAVFGAVTLVLQEVESKTIYLLITRPLRRVDYLVGRILGLIVAVAFTMMAMACFHVVVLRVDGQAFRVLQESMSFWTVYPALVAMSLLKMVVTTSIAVFFSLFATSAVSALVFTGFFWISGHFGSELSFVIERSFSGGTQAVIKTLSWIIPNFQFLNFRDSYAIPGFPGFEFIQWAVLYALAYAGAYLALSTALFSRKEF